MVPLWPEDTRVSLEVCRAAEQSVVFNSMAAGLPGVCPAAWYKALRRVLEDAKSGEVDSEGVGSTTYNRGSQNCCSQYGYAAYRKHQGATSLLKSAVYLRKCRQRTHGCLRLLSEMHPFD